MSNIPTPFVGGTESPRRGPDEEKALQPPYAPPGGESAAKAGASALGADDHAGPEQPIHVDVAELDEEDLLPDMSTEGEEIAIEGPTYDLEWPEVPEPEAVAEPSETTDAAPVTDLEAAPAQADVIPGGTEMPDFLLGPDSSEAGPAAKPVYERPPILPKEELVQMALELQEGTLGEFIRGLVADLSVYKAEIAVPRAFAAGYLAAKKQEEEK